MKTTKHWAWVLLPSIALLASCQSDTMVQRTDEATPITFAGATGAAVRVHGASWSAKDSVGVSVYHATTAAALGQNYAYVTTAGDGNFTPAPTAHYYPHTGDAVHVTAYYPYTASAVQGGAYAVDLVKGVNTDLLFAKSSTAWTAAMRQGALNFTRQLAAIDFQITTNLDITTAPQVTINGLPTRANIDLATGTLTTVAGSQAAYMRTAEGSGKVWSVRVPVLPGVDATKAQVTFVLDTITRTVALPSGTTFAAGEVKAINVPIKGLKAVDPAPNPQPQPGPNYEAYFETPTITSEQLAANRYVVHNFTGSDKRSFALLYSPTLRIAYWVAYPLTTSHQSGSGKRTDDWGYDPKVPQSEQANLSNSYNGPYDRGHQLPSADRLTTNADNAKTFYYTNMTPQINKLNQGPWAELEKKVRNWSSGVDTLYVVTGAMPTTADDLTIDYATDKRGTRVAIPKYYFKALARRTGGKMQTIAFVYNNTAHEDKNHMTHAISVAQLEQKTGFTFFPTLSTADKASFDGSLWR